MPADNIGQLITFAIQIDPNWHYSDYIYVRALANDTIAKICARKGHPELVSDVLALNTDIRLKHGHFLRSARQPLRAGTLVRLPGIMRQGESFSVHADDPRPVIKDGYAIYNTVKRPGRVGINRFEGYNPVEISAPVQFEGYADDRGVEIEQSIDILERMAGRGHFPGAPSGPPAVIRVSVTDSAGQPVWLIPSNYQWSQNNPTAPLYRVAGIAWAEGALSDDRGQRVRAKATITLKEYTPVSRVVRSAVQRSKAKQ